MLLKKDKYLQTTNINKILYARDSHNEIRHIRYFGKFDKNLKCMICNQDLQIVNTEFGIYLRHYSNSSFCELKQINSRKSYNEHMKNYIKAFINDKNKNMKIIIHNKILIYPVINIENHYIRNNKPPELYDIQSIDINSFDDFPKDFYVNWKIIDDFMHSDKTLLEINHTTIINENDIHILNSDEQIVRNFVIDKQRLVSIISKDIIIKTILNKINDSEEWFKNWIRNEISTIKNNNINFPIFVLSINEFCDLYCIILRNYYHINNAKYIKVIIKKNTYKDIDTIEPLKIYTGNLDIMILPVYIRLPNSLIKKIYPINTDYIVITVELHISSFTNEWNNKISFHRTWFNIYKKSLSTKINYIDNIEYCSFELLNIIYKFNNKISIIDNNSFDIWKNDLIQNIDININKNNTILYNHFNNYIKNLYKNFFKKLNWKYEIIENRIVLKFPKRNIYLIINHKISSVEKLDNYYKIISPELSKSKKIVLICGNQIFPHSDGYCLGYIYGFDNGNYIDDFVIIIHHDNHYGLLCEYGTWNCLYCDYCDGDSIWSFVDHKIDNVWNSIKY